MSTADTLTSYADVLTSSTDGLFSESLRPLRHSLRDLNRGKRELKNLRRRETICLRRAAPPVAAIRLSTNFHLIHNALRQILYGLIRIAEPAREHVDNNFSPISDDMAHRYCRLRQEVVALMHTISENLRNQRASDNDALFSDCDRIEADLIKFNQDISVAIQGDDTNLNSATLMLHMVQETQQLILEIKELLQAAKAFRQQSAQ